MGADSKAKKKSLSNENQKVHYHAYGVVQLVRKDLLAC